MLSVPDSTHTEKLSPTISHRRGDGMTRRKLSYPVGALEASGLHSHGSRRRFSHVSDAVSRKFSQTLGWGGPPREAAAAEVLAQARLLCDQYIQARLRRSGVPGARKLGLQRARSALLLPLSVREVLPALIALGREAERLQPRVYSGVVRQTCHVVSERGLAVVLPAVARRLMRAGVSWCRVVSLYAVAGGLALDCVSQGHPEYLHVILESMCQALETDVALWIADNGGWDGLVSLCRPQEAELTYSTCYAVVAMVALFSLLVAAGAVKLYTKYS